MSITRRVFLRNGALAVVGTAAIPAFLTRAAFSAVGWAGNKRLVVIFQRGAADGLNIVVPHGEQAYYAMRPSINIPRNAVLDLDGFFGLHPAMSAFQPLWNQRPSGDCACGRLARPEPFALRCPGFYGVRHARHQGHGRWLAQSHLAVASLAGGQVCVSRDRPGAVPAANSCPDPNRRWP